MFHSKAANKRCPTKISVLQKPVQELAFLHVWSKTKKLTPLDLSFKIFDPKFRTAIFAEHLCLLHLF